MTDFANRHQVEEHLAELGQLLDDEVTNIKNAVGQVGDIRLLLMAGLVIADRLSDTLKKVEDLQDQVDNLRSARVSGEVSSSEIDQAVSSRLVSAAERLEQLAKNYTAAEQS